MTSTTSGRASQVYRIVREDGRRFLIYNAAELGNPPDHVPDRWYYRPYDPACPIGLQFAASFASAEEAEEAARNHSDNRN